MFSKLALMVMNSFIYLLNREDLGKEDHLQLR